VRVATVEPEAASEPWTRRLISAAIGHPATRRLALTHAIDDVADSLITLSLLGSLFFNVSLDASRTQILMYLLLAAAPLALVAPAVGPLLDRSRVGYRWVVAGTQLSRALLALGLAGSLRTLAFYPLVFGILLARKAYALARTAVVAQLLPNENELVRASGLLARVGTVAGGAGTALGGALILVIGVEWLPVVAAGVYLVAAGISTTLPATSVEGLTAAAIVRAETPSDVNVATAAVALIRAAAGALTFLLALAIKRGGGDEWIYASALVAAGVGAFVGTMIAPRLHRRLASERIIAVTLLAPALVSALGVLIVGNMSIIAIALSIGMAGSVAARAMDALYGRIPQLVRGRAISRSELFFQLANVAGAVCAVVATPSPRVGFAVVALVLLSGGLAYSSRISLSIRHEAGSFLLGRRTGASDDLAHSLLDQAVRCAEQGNHAMAIAVADAAARIAVTGNDGGVDTREWDGLRAAIESVVLRRRPASAHLAVAVVATARSLVDAAGTADAAESGAAEPAAAESG
jgi:predicted MFS family arabinose efflux permease